MKKYMLDVYVILIGLILGSFTNVCIWRIPREESVIFPGSKCPNCGKNIRWYHNIPLLSYILLKGKCADCNEKISVQYFVVELLTCLALFLLYKKFGVSTELVFSSLLTVFFIIIGGIDFYHKIIPDVLSLSLIVISLILAVFNPFILNDVQFIVSQIFDMSTGNTIWYSIIYAVLSIFSVGGGMYLIAVLGELLLKKESMGGGDVKLMAAIAGFIGIYSSLVTLFIASCMGAAVGISMIIFKRLDKDEPIPFGPFIVAAAYFVLLFKQKT